MMRRIQRVLTTFSSSFYGKHHLCNKIHRQYGGKLPPDNLLAYRAAQECQREQAQGKLTVKYGTYLDQ